MSRYRRRFFIDPSNINGDRITIYGSDAGHITRVLQLGPGDTIRLIDSGRSSHIALIEKASPEAVECVLTSDEKIAGADHTEVMLEQAIPKGRTMELIIRKATELGVSGVTPVKTERCVSLLSGEKAEQKLHRWRKVAAEAAKQCSRFTIPQVTPVKTFPELLHEGAEAELKIMLYEEEGNTSLRRALADVRRASGVNVLVGAEGGFTSQEAEEARAGGYITVSMGPRILRTDTASLALLAILIYELGAMEP
jgi:16S rRNA (uracil1498-N3)-methyltransferase